jgi:hypothetical protein
VQERASGCAWAEPVELGLTSNIDHAFKNTNKFLFGSCRRKLSNFLQAHTFCSFTPGKLDGLGVSTLHPFAPANSSPTNAARGEYGPAHVLEGRSRKPSPQAGALKATHQSNRHQDSRTTFDPSGTD